MPDTAGMECRYCYKYFSSLLICLYDICIVSYIHWTLTRYSDMRDIREEVVNLTDFEISVVVELFSK